MAEPTHFVESNALLAIINDDELHAAEIIAAMLPGERQALASAADELYQLCSVNRAETVLALKAKP